MPIRFKVLAVVSLLLLAAVATYMLLATNLMVEDRVAYVYDVNAGLVRTMSEQVTSELEVTADHLRLFATEMARRDEAGAKELAELLFGGREQLVDLEVYRPDVETDGRWRRTFRFFRAESVDAEAIDAAMLDEARGERRVPFDGLAAAGVHFANGSIPPELALLTVAVSHPSIPLVAVAALRPDRLLRIFARSDAYTAYLLDETGRVLVHPDPEMTVAATLLADHPIVAEALESRAPHGATEFADEDGKRFLGAFAVTSAGRAIVVAEVPRKAALAAVEHLARKSVLFAVAIVLAAFVVSIVFSRLLTRRLGKLEAATLKIGRGEFDVQVGVHGRDEIGRLAASFGRMAQELRTREQELRAVQARLVQSAKMAAFGELGAGITHEIKNPLAAVIGCAELVRLKFDNREKAMGLLETIEREARRCVDTINSLLRFARQEGVEKGPVELPWVLDAVLKVSEHQLSLKDVQATLEVTDDLPLVEGNINQLQQVFLNLVLNAQQAMKNGGTIELHARCTADGDAEVVVRDTGEGMPPEVAERIFEPFFTTKAAGEGTGLGLSVSYGIVQDHGGTIAVQSEVGQGTTFIVTLPARSAESRERAKRS